jgi:phosphate:Na+ symporter
VAYDPAITTHLAMLHTIFNTINTLLFIPFVNPFAKLVSRIIKEDKDEAGSLQHYKLVSFTGAMQNTPELSIVRAEKEIRDMAGLASSMFGRVSGVLLSLLESQDRQTLIDDLVKELQQREAYADEMHEQISGFLLECAREQLNPRSEQHLSRLLRVISDLEEMTDDCCSIAHLLDNSVKKDHIFGRKEMDALTPYLKQVEDFLSLVQENLGRTPSAARLQKARELEDAINENRDKLRRLGRKRLEAGKDVRTELLFIDLVRRIEKLGDYCSDISEMVEV